MATSIHLKPSQRLKMLAAVADLRGEDHAFLSEKEAKVYGEAFGVVVRCSLYEANPEHPKGLTLANGAKSAVGVDAALAAMQICRQLDVDYADKLGRGFQLRACCDALEAWLKQEDAK